MTKLIIELSNNVMKNLKKPYHSYTDIHDTLAYPLYDAAMEAIQHKNGHWIKNRPDVFICSECGYVHTDMSGDKAGMKFCGECGIKMEEIN